MEYTRNIVLDVNVISASTVVRAKQGDGSTRFVNITLTRDSAFIAPEIGSTAQFRLEKPDKKVVLNTAVINSDGTITVELTNQCTAVPGRAKADICIMKNGNCISTAVFYLDILASPDIATRTLSMDEFGLLEEAIARSYDAAEDARRAIDDANEAIETANDAAQYVIDNEPTATTSREDGDNYATFTVVDINGTTESRLYDGKSAYEGAVERGYEGTELEFDTEHAENTLTFAEFDAIEEKLNIL